MRDKKLSKLQKAILIICLHPEYGSNRGIIRDCTPADVKKFYYCFPVTGSGSLLFSVKNIGLSRYRAAGVAISRSFDSLARRGLVQRFHSWSGVRLTDEGREIALSIQRDMRGAVPISTAFVLQDRPCNHKDVSSKSRC